MMYKEGWGEWVLPVADLRHTQRAGACAARLTDRMTTASGIIDTISLSQYTHTCVAQPCAAADAWSPAQVQLPRPSAPWSSAHLRHDNLDGSSLCLRLDRLQLCALGLVGAVMGEWAGC